MKKIILVIIVCALNVLNSYGNSYRVSERGKNLIKKHETCQLTSYWDSNGYSIGWGHHRKEVKKGQVITKRKAEQFFCEDIAIAEKSINTLISDLPYKYRFSQGFVDGLTSLVYNCGEGGVRNSKFYTVLKRCRVSKGKINTNDLNYAISFVKTTNITAKGHIERRFEEMKMMLNA